MLELIYDRTEQDLLNDTDKAYISYADLNRVENACKYLANKLGVQIVTKQWRMSDYRTESDMKRLSDNLDKIKKAYFSFKGMRVPPAEVKYESIYEANNIEGFLHDLEEFLIDTESGKQNLTYSFGRKSLGNRR